MKRQIKLFFRLLIAVFIFCFLICFSVNADDAKNNSSASASAKPQLIGQTLLKTKKELNEKINSLDKEIEAVNHEISLYSSREMFGIPSFFDGAIPYFNFIACVWTSLLLFMYQKIRKQEYLKNKRWLLLFLLSFFAVGLLCIITGAASASESPPHQPDLIKTLEQTKQSAAMEPKRRVLEALEEQNCDHIEIPQDVLSWISQNCPDAEILNPIEGQGPHRFAAIAAIYWAFGEKSKAIEKLKPLASESFYPRSNKNVSGFKTALSLLAASNDPDAGKIARQMMGDMDTSGLVLLAKKLRSCCFEVAMESLDRAKYRAATADDVILIAQALRDFAKSEDANKYLLDHMDMTYRFNALIVFLDFAKKEKLTDIEQQILSWNVEHRNGPDDLAELASVLNENGYTDAAKRAIEKAIEKESRSNGLMNIASIAIQWNLLKTAQTALMKLIDIEGLDGAKKEFPDPMFLPASQEKPVNQNPSIGVVIGMIAEKLGDKDTAQSYYSDFLDFEIYDKFMCLGTARDIHFTNFFYPYRFFVSQNNTTLLRLLEPIGQELENSMVAEFKNQKEPEIRKKQNQLNALKKELSTLKFKKFLWKTSQTLLALFSFIFFIVLTIAHIIAIRRMLEWVSRLDHLKTLGGFSKFLELEGFILLASIVFSPIGFLLILLSQRIHSILLTEAHTFRISEHIRIDKGKNWLKIPLTYRD